MRGIHHSVHVGVEQPATHPVDAAEAADPHLADRQSGSGTRPASELITSTSG